MARISGYTRHAEDSLRVRKIEKSWLEEAFQTPSYSIPDRRDPALKRVYVEDPMGRMIRIVVKPIGDDNYDVITVHPDRNALKAINR